MTITDDKMKYEILRAALITRGCTDSYIDDMIARSTGIQPVVNGVSSIKKWFEQAVPTPAPSNRLVQLGVHFEEVAEMLDAIGEDVVAAEAHAFATQYKTQTRELTGRGIDRKELLDALCDQIVTAIGVAHMYDLDIVEAIGRVDKSNWSKYVDGKPLFDANGKITKGPNYHKPDLTGLY